MYTKFKIPSRIRNRAEFDIMNDEPLITSRVVSSNLQDDALLERPIDEGFSVVRQEQEQDRSIQMEHQALRN